MPEPADARVAVYIDFDNIVISRFAQKNRQDGERTINLSALTAGFLKANPAVAERLEEARVDLGAVLDFASSFGTISVGRAYADWSLHVNAMYKDQLMDRAVDLVQLFPAVRQSSADKPAKNGADIRLAVDVVEDLFLLPDVTHIVIVAGDSDYIALAQRCKRLGRYVVGIGVAGSTSKFLASACDEFADYDALPGVTDLQEIQSAAPPATKSAQAKDAKAGSAASTSPDNAKASAPKKASAGAVSGEATSKTPQPPAQRAATELLRRALRLAEAKDDVDWIASSAVKNQMLRMEPAFQESALGYKNFTEFVKSRQNEIELKEEGLARLIRRRAAASADKSSP